MCIDILYFFFLKRKIDVLSPPNYAYNIWTKAMFKNELLNVTELGHMSIFDYIIWVFSLVELPPLFS